MKFNVLAAGIPLTKGITDQVFLIEDKWDDNFKFEVTYTVVIVNDKGEFNKIGSVKIGKKGLTKDDRRADIPLSFESLSDDFFSLGIDGDYYESISRQGRKFADQFFVSLNDVAYNLSLFNEYKFEEVMRSALLRSVSPLTIKNQFHRIAHGGAKLTKYKLSYTSADNPPYTIDFDVSPDSDLPTNINVVIGRNGVGKTRLLESLSHVILDPDANDDCGKISYPNLPFAIGAPSDFSGLVFVSFSAFDEKFVEPPQPIEGLENYTEASYSYIGLKRQNADGKIELKSPSDLRDEFVESLILCSKDERKRIWKAAIGLLKSDPIFNDYQFIDLIEKDDLRLEASHLFSKLSSGHKIVLLTITKLIEEVQEARLVLLDEPESHLHPPLLATFIRTLSYILTELNGVALIATHSPVILQEVPTTCVWKMFRHGEICKVEHPRIETFGENIGILTHEVFNLEVTDSGFYNLLREMVDNDTLSPDLYNSLGSEAKAHLLGLQSFKKHIL